MSENTNASQGLAYNIDIVFCIDVSSLSSAELKSLNDFVLRFPTDLVRRHESQGKNLQNVRVRFVLFPDASANHSHEFSHFLSLNSEKGSERFQTFVQSLRLTKHQTDTKKSLRALFDALHSDWTQLGERQRHIIVLTTGVGLHGEIENIRSSDQKTFQEIDTLLNEMTDYWDGAMMKPGTRKAKLNQVARRLVLIAPDIYPWPTIGDSWAQTLFLPSKAGEGLSEVEYDTILEVIQNSV